MPRFEAFLAAISRALLAGAGILVLVMTGLVVLASFMRYFVGSPFAFTEELVALMFLAMVFLTIPISTVRREHIVVTVCVERAGPLLQRVLALLSLLVMLVFAGWFVVEAYVSAAFSRKIGARSDQVDLLLWPWMGIMPVVMAFVGVITILHVWQAVRDLRSGGGPLADHHTGDRL